MHLPTREKFIEEMAAALRPGGWLLVEDMDVFPLTTLAENAFAHVWTKVVGAFEAASVTATFGRQLPDLFDRAGLDAVEPVCDVPVFRGDSPFAGMFTASVAQMRPPAPRRRRYRGTARRLRHLKWPMRRRWYLRFRLLLRTRPKPGWLIAQARVATKTGISRSVFCW